MTYAIQGDVEVPRTLLEPKNSGNIIHISIVT